VIQVRSFYQNAGLGAGNRSVDRVRGGQPLTSGLRQGCCEGMGPAVGSHESVVVGQHGLAVAAAEVHGAGVAGGHVPVGVLKNHGHIP